MVPTYVLWNSTDTGQIYTIPKVITDNSPQDPGNYVEHKGLRGRGSIIIEGTDKAPWDLVLRFVLTGDDYDDLIAKMEAIESTIVKNTPYILKIGNRVDEYKVKRLIPIEWEEGRRYNIQYATLTLRVNSWS